MKSPKNIFVCTECGERYAKWQGQCSSCKSWNSLEERADLPAKKTVLAASRTTSAGGGKVLSRLTTGIAELDVLLGGGLVAGSVVLLGGEPGVGKSTLLLELCRSGHKIAYATGEESLEQVTDRAKRTGTLSPGLLLIQENHAPSIIAAFEKEKPDIALIDSIQAIWQEGGRGFSGSVAQVREAAQLFIEYAKKSGVPVIMTGHITKEGQIAGPKLLEHAVDVVLYFETASHGTHRLVRSVKNRFGATGEIALFEMTANGLRVQPAGKSLVHLDNIGGIGSILFPQMEGSRVLPLEIQVLVTPTGFANGRRIGESIDIARIHLIAAILEKYARYKLSQCDIFVRISGGAPLNDPAGDLALLLAMASSYLDRPLPRRLAAAGELSLTGQIRAPAFAEERQRALLQLGVEAAYWGGKEQSRGGLRLTQAEEVPVVLSAAFPGVTS